MEVKSESKKKIPSNREQNGMIVSTAFKVTESKMYILLESYLAECTNFTWLRHIIDYNFITYWTCFATNVFCRIISIVYNVTTNQTIFTLNTGCSIARLILSFTARFAC